MGVPAKRHPWPDVKKVYVEGVLGDNDTTNWPGLREVASMFDIHESRVRERSSKDGWVEQRAAYQAHVEKVRQEKRSAQLATEAVEMDKRALTVAKMGLNLCAMRTGEIMQKAQQTARARAEGGPGQEDDYGLPLVDARELETLARASMAWHQLGGRALGEVETTRTELTGAAGRPLEVHQSIRAELIKDDPQRLHGFIVALQRSQLLTLGMGDDEEGGDGADEAPIPE